jgi:arsenical pump membrane protein
MMLVCEFVAIFFLYMASRSKEVNIRSVLKGAPWAIVFFSIGMYVVVYGLRNAGLTNVLADVIKLVSNHGLFAGTIAMGYISAILSSIMNT